MENRTALVVIDVQPVFMKDPRMVTINGDDLVSKCATLIKQARTAGIRVIYVQHIDRDDMPADVREEDVAFASELSPQPNDIVVGKQFGSGFMETDLHDRLQALGIDRVVACGLSAYGCVNATVQYAKLLGYDVTVVSDAVAAPDHSGFPPTLGIPKFQTEWLRAGIKVIPSDKIQLV